MNNITSPQILQHMEDLGIERKDLEKELSLNSGDFSSYLTGNKEIPPTRQSQFYWYFRAKELEKRERDLQDVSEGIIIQEYKTIISAIWDAMVRLQNVRDWGRDYALLTQTITIMPGEENYLSAKEKELETLYDKALETLKAWGTRK